MLVMVNYKFKFGEYFGSTRAFNTLAKNFKDIFKIELLKDENENLYIMIEDENNANEEYVKNMFYYIKGYVTANKTIHFYQESKFN